MPYLAVLLDTVKCSLFFNNLFLRGGGGGGVPENIMGIKLKLNIPSPWLKNDCFIIRAEYDLDKLRLVFFF